MSATEASHVVEFPIEKGQNEGQAIQVLPVGEFSALRNARFRKNNLLGKRNGYTSKSSLDADGAALGNGGGLLTCVGPNFCAVDDRFYQRDAVADAWAAPLSLISGSVQTRRVLNRFPMCMPASAIKPTTVESLVESANAGMVYALGYVWVAQAHALFDSSGWSIKVEALDPDTGRVAFTDDIPLSNATASDVPFVQLLAMGNGTVVLITDRFTAFVKTSVACYTLTSLAGGFSSAATFTCAQSAFGPYAAVNNRLLFVHTLTGSPTTLRIGVIDPETGTVTAGTTVATAGNKTRLSVFEATGGEICVGFFDATNVMSHLYSAAFASVGIANVTALVADAAAPIMYANGPNLTELFVLVFGGSTTSSIYSTGKGTTGVLIGSYVRQRNGEALSLPFNLGTQVFIWGRCVAGESLGVATLLRVPGTLEYSFPGTDFPGPFPVQATVDDRDVAPPPVAATSGQRLSRPVSTPGGYLALINYTRDSFIQVGSITRRRAHLVVPVRFRSEGVRYSYSCVVPCTGRQFVAGGQPQWAGPSRLHEAGFVREPAVVGSAVPAGGGSMTPSSTYSYAAVYQSESESGIERSAPSLPVQAVLGAGDSQVTTVWTTMEFGQRDQVSCRIYRTVANGSVFYLVNQFDATPGSNATGLRTFVDLASDADIIQNEALYINIGQELPAANYPACSFANVGGSRLWVGGGFTGNIVTASKRFVPYIAPEFADDDAFRVSLPADCTGGAWCDSQVLFTQEGIYVVSGEGPDGAGEGFFTTSRLPFNIGCIDWRSVGTCDMGVFFQSARGLHLLPRGFGQPIPMDQVIDTLTTYPIITSARSDYSSRGGADTSEQVIQWTAVADEAASAGVVITFDSAYKAFYVDTCNADFPAVFQTGWDGDAVQSPGVMTVGPNGAAEWHPFRVRDTSFDDQGLTIDFSAVTGDVRPWGTFGHGVIERLGILGVMRSACTVSVTKTTDKGVRAGAQRAYTGSAPDPVAGSEFYLAVDLGSVEQKDVTRLRTQIDESSTVEGVALVAMILEVGDTRQNYKLLRIADRIQ